MTDVQDIFREMRSKELPEGLHRYRVDKAEDPNYKKYLLIKKWRNKIEVVGIFPDFQIMTDYANIYAKRAA